MMFVCVPSLEFAGVRSWKVSIQTDQDPKKPVHADKTRPSAIVNGFSVSPHVQEGENPNRLDPQNPVYAEETSPSVIVNGFSEKLRASHIQRIRPHSENLGDGEVCPFFLFADVFCLSHLRGCCCSRDGTRHHATHWHQANILNLQRFLQELIEEREAGDVLDQLLDLGRVFLGSIIQRGTREGFTPSVAAAPQLSRCTDAGDLLPGKAERCSPQPKPRPTQAASRRRPEFDYFLPPTPLGCFLLFCSTAIACTVRSLKFPPSEVRIAQPMTISLEYKGSQQFVVTTKGPPTSTEASSQDNLTPLACKGSRTSACSLRLTPETFYFA
ncbi:hypothetical protein U0070_025922 [Myodes glareolus]|uniref:Uncharacterized protein n=1 Tax=Myodes glareolus TaxID=447135 RepID=A0AAW0HU99_MYOGA